MIKERPPALIDSWLAPEARLLERHETKVPVPPEQAYDTALLVTFREMPVVRVLFWLRGISHSSKMTIRQFFSTPPFLVLEESPGQEVVFGIAGRAGAPVSSPQDFRSLARTGSMKAIANFRVDARGRGSVISTETWVATFGRLSGVLFRAYWLVVGPFSALIRREFLRAARKRTRP